MQTEGEMFRKQLQRNMEKKKILMTCILLKPTFTETLSSGI